MKSRLVKSESASIAASLHKVADELLRQNLSRKAAIREARAKLAPVLMLRQPSVRSTDQATLAGRMNVALKAADMNQSTLAKACGLKQPSVAKWLDGGTKSLEGKNLLRAAAALNVCPLWLAEGEGPMRPDPAPSSPSPARSRPRAAIKTTKGE